MLSIEFWVQRLSAIGLWLFLAGAAMLAGSTIWEVLRFASGGGELTATVYFARAVLSLGEPLLYNGVVFYVAGHLMSAWNVSVVGLEQGSGSKLFVKGPDSAHTVWIGRQYQSTAAAENAAVSLRKRLGLEDREA